MKKIYTITIILLFSFQLFTKEETTIKPEHLTLETFKEKIFDFDINVEWNYKGELPAVVDFYADWCGPCRQVAPIIDELTVEYAGRVNFYKVDTQKQRELAGIFGIRSIPSILFIPTEGKPQMVSGAYPKDGFIQLIQEHLKID